MTRERDYPCKCHVCEREFTIRTTFLGGVDWLLPDGRRVTMHACASHTADEVRAAWNRVTQGRNVTRAELSHELAPSGGAS